MGRLLGNGEMFKLIYLLVCVNIYIYTYIYNIYIYVFNLNPFEKYSSKWIISPNSRCDFFWNNYLKPPSLANDLPAMSKCQAPKGHEKHWPPSSSVTRRGVTFSIPSVNHGDAPIIGRSKLTTKIQQPDHFRKQLGQEKDSPKPTKL